MREGVIKESGNSSLTAWQIFTRAQNENGPCLYLTSELERQTSIWQNLLVFKKILHPEIIIHRGIDGKTLFLLWHNIKSALILSEDELKIPIIPPEQYRALLQAIAPGIRTAPRKLASLLQSFEFLPQSHASTSLSPAQFSMFGGQMRVNDPFSENEYMVEFNEEKITRVKPSPFIIGPMKIKPGDSSLWSYVNENHILLKELLFGGSMPEELENINLENAEDAKNLLTEFLPKDFRVICAIENESVAPKLSELLQIAKYKERISTIWPRPLSAFPFIDKREKIIFITDKELLPVIKAETEQKIRKSRPPIKEKIRPGDFLVHLDHGIGIFKGIFDNYFLLEYAQSDKLYVPVALEDKLDIYIGATAPKINRLGTASWEETKQKVKEDLQKIAEDLLSIYAAREMSASTPFPPNSEEYMLEKSFEYDLTPDQKTALNQTLKDLEDATPQDRLICGDVGFGKTEIAMRAAYRTILNNHQVVLLCPTTILAQQHFDTFSRRLEPLGVKTSLISRTQTPQEQKNVLDRLKNGDIDLIIGTHRIIQDDVEFDNLGLAIIDEEQKFGIKQKEYLKKLRASSNVISLSATPIPRTLNLALSGLRQMSVIGTPPEGRQAVETHIGQYNKEMLKESVLREISRNGQVFYLFNKVQAMNMKLEELRKLFPDLAVAYAHGQMDKAKLFGTMSEFNHGKIDILIATTIIENGLDLPNVNTLIVEDSTKFGLSTLYQLRGRIGRSSRKAYAYFFYSREKLKGRVLGRLQALERANSVGSGLGLALEDMEIRGVGSVLGKRQHGHVVLIGLNLYLELLEEQINKLRNGGDINGEQQRIS